jgi:hypothetical protein
METQMDIHSIMAHLPHRYPFLLVDRILELVPSKRVTGLKNVTMNETVFPGTFSGKARDAWCIDRRSNGPDRWSSGYLLSQGEQRRCADVFYGARSGQIPQNCDTRRSAGDGTRSVKTTLKDNETCRHCQSRWVNCSGSPAHGNGRGLAQQTTLTADSNQLNHRLKLAEDKQKRANPYDSSNGDRQPKY